MPSRSSTLSNAFSKTVKLVNKRTFHSMHCSVMFWRGKSGTMQPRPVRNLVCSGLNLGSMSLSIILRNVLQNTLLEMSWNGERCYVLPQLLQLLRPPSLESCESSSSSSSNDFPHGMYVSSLRASSLGSSWVGPVHEIAPMQRIHPWHGDNKKTSLRVDWYSW